MYWQKNRWTHTQNFKKSNQITIHHTSIKIMVKTSPNTARKIRKLIWLKNSLGAQVSSSGRLAPPAFPTMSMETTSKEDALTTTLESWCHHWALPGVGLGDPRQSFPAKDILIYEYQMPQCILDVKFMCPLRFHTEKTSLRYPPQGTQCLFSCFGALVFFGSLQTSFLLPELSLKQTLPFPSHCKQRFFLFCSQSIFELAGRWGVSKDR